MLHYMIMYYCLIQYTIIVNRHHNKITHHFIYRLPFDRPPSIVRRPMNHDRTGTVFQNDQKSDGTFLNIFYFR